jgi:putative membrane protein
MVIKMPFVDSLTVMLIGLAMGLALGAFYFFFRAREDEKMLNALIVPAFVVGLFDFMSGFLMSFTWPLPGAYDMLFGDPLLLFGLILVMTSVAYYKKMNLGLIPVLSLLLGIYVLVGAYTIVQMKTLETGNDEITAVGLYIFSGIGALLAPIAYIKPSSGNKYLYYAEWIILGIATVFALVIGYTGFNAHLQSPP